MTTCPVCSEPATSRFLSRSSVPVNQHQVFDSEEAAIAIPRGSLELHVCRTCGFVFNGAFAPSLLRYDQRYDNSQTFSPTFEEYLRSLAQRLVHESGVRDAHVVEIGCGKGHFLNMLLAVEGAGNRGTGFDPSYEGPDTALQGRAHFRREFFGTESGVVDADVVVCRHVIEHIPDPVDFLRTVRAAVEANPRVRVFFETPAVEWILENQVVWDFFYEHCSLFSERSLASAFRLAGFEVVSVTRVFGGQYLWLEARLGSGRSEPLAPAGAVPELASAFGAAEARLTTDWHQRIRSLAERGPVAIWGAGAKGATIANLVDPDREHIACVVDLNPNKQGRFLPGTGHPIVAPQELPDRRVDTAVLMNPNYRDEIARFLLEARIPVALAHDH